MTINSHKQQSKEASTLVQDLLRESAMIADKTQDVRGFVGAATAIACLAKRGIFPTHLQESPGHELFKALSAGELSDSSLFASRSTKLLNRIHQSHNGIWRPEVIAEVFKRRWDLFADPLMPGWAVQCLSSGPRSSIVRTQIGIPSQQLRAADLSAAHLPLLTQWFTPPWIARFLINESLPALASHEARLIDPACGAGHILVTALLTLAKLNHQPQDHAVHHALAQQLVGLDIDPLMVELSAMSLYLAARDLVPSGELPSPLLYHFQGQPPASLLLATPASSSACATGLADTLPLSAPLFTRPFQAVVTNPPYLGHRLMPKDLRRFLQTHYHASSFDLYAAFLEMCMRILAPQGKLALICQQSFMSISRYQPLRLNLLQTTCIDSLVQLGPGAFAHRTGEKVNCALIVATKLANGSPPVQLAAVETRHAKDRGGLHPAMPERDFECAFHQAQDCRGGLYQPADGRHTTKPLRCARILTKGEKSRAEIHGIEQLLSRGVNNFHLLPGNIWSFWCPSRIAALFKSFTPLQHPDSGITLTNGLFTCNNSLFVLNHRSVPPEQKELYVPYDKGGGQKWFCTTPWMLKWGITGDGIREYRAARGQSTALPGEEFYFRPGITYSYIGTKGFKARCLSPGSVFDIASSSVFSNILSLDYLLGYLNSSLVRFLLGVLNPTVNFQIGDLRRLPFAQPDPIIVNEVELAARKAVSAAKVHDQLDPKSPAFRGFDLIPEELSAREAHAHYLDILANLTKSEKQCQRVIDDCIFELYTIDSATRELIEQDPWVVRGHEQVFPALPLKTFTSAWTLRPIRQG